MLMTVTMLCGIIYEFSGIKTGNTINVKASHLMRFCYIQTHANAHECITCVRS
jgi:hypothetical protein